MSELIVDDTFLTFVEETKHSVAMPIKSQQVFLTVTVKIHPSELAGVQASSPRHLSLEKIAQAAKE